jgi:hypothetical protein
MTSRRMTDLRSPLGPDARAFLVYWPDPPIHRARRATPRAVHEDAERFVDRWCVRWPGDSACPSNVAVNVVEWRGGAEPACHAARLTAARGGRGRLRRPRLEAAAG